MPLIIPDGFSHVTHIMLDSNTGKFNSVSYAVDNTLWPDMVDLAQGLHNEFFTQWDSEVDNSFSLTSTRLLSGTSGGPEISTEYTPGAQLFLRNTGSAAAGANAVIMSKKTLFAGRQFRGRLYLPGTLSEADVDEAGRVTPARVTALQTLATQWLQHLDDATGPHISFETQMVLLHDSPRSGGPAPAPTPVSSLIVRSMYGIVRRRRPRV